MFNVKAIEMMNLADLVHEGSALLPAGRQAIPLP